MPSGHLIVPPETVLIAAQPTRFAPARVAAVSAAANVRDGGEDTIAEARSGGTDVPLEIASSRTLEACSDLAAVTAVVPAAAVGCYDTNVEARFDIADRPLEVAGGRALEACSDLAVATATAPVCAVSSAAADVEVLYSHARIAAARVEPSSLTAPLPTGDTSNTAASFVPPPSGGRGSSPASERCSALEARCLELEQSLKGRDGKLRELQEMAARTAQELEHRERQVEETAVQCTALTQRLEQSESETMAVAQRARELELEVQRLAAFREERERRRERDKPEDSPESLFARQVREVNAGRLRNEVPVIEANLIGEVGDYRELPTLAALRNRLHDHKDAHSEYGAGSSRGDSATPQRATRTASTASTASQNQRGSKGSKGSKRSAQDNVWR